MKVQPSQIKPESWLVSAGRPSEAGASLNVPIVPASNFLMGSEREYSRNEGNPTWEALEEVIGGLENGKSVAFASGMAAVTAVFDQLKAGSVVALPDDCYQGVAGVAAAGAEKGFWSVQRVPVSDTEAWKDACKIADLIWLESTSNPLLTVPDLEVLCSAQRKPGAILAVDSTFATPLNQQPLQLGATLSMHSATKFIGGHSDLLGGVVTTKDENLWNALRATRGLTGATPGTLEAFLAVRGVRTLAIRLERAQKTAMILAERLQEHRLVSVVRYPGLPSHPTHAIAKRMLEGFGTIISFDLTGDAAFADRVSRNVQIIKHATSLGAVESTMERRAATHGQEHLPPTLLRISVGIEDADDLWNDLDSAILESV